MSHFEKCIPGPRELVRTRLPATLARQGRFPLWLAKKFQMGVRRGVGKHLVTPERHGLNPRPSDISVVDLS
jgi:hypothetical protein